MRPPFSLVLEPEDFHLSTRLHELSESFLNSLLASEPSKMVDVSLAQLLSSAFHDAGADEGTVWLERANELTPIWNNGPDAERFVGHFRLPATSGITGMVFSTGLSACESEVCFQKHQHRALDERLGVATWAMLAVPLKFLGAVRGVITAVKLVRFDHGQPLPASRAEWPPSLPVPTSFSLAALSHVEHAATLTGQLLGHRVRAWALNQDA
jgi:hypothetical protein